MRSTLARRGLIVIDPHHMDKPNFEWTPGFWQGWRKSSIPYLQCDEPPTVLGGWLMKSGSVA